MRSRLSSLMLYCGVPLCASDAAGPGAAGIPAAPKIQRYKARGTVRSHREGSSLAVIAHDEIPGFLEAMTAPLSVRNRAELLGLRAGNAISFRINVRGEDCWIDQVKSSTDARHLREARGAA